MASTDQSDPVVPDNGPTTTTTSTNPEKRGSVDSSDGSGGGDASPARATNPIVEAFNTLFEDDAARRRGTSFPGNLPFDSERPLVLPQHSDDTPITTAPHSTGGVSYQSSLSDHHAGTAASHTTTSDRRDSDWEEITADEAIERGGLHEHQPLVAHRVSYLDDGPRGPELSDENTDRTIPRDSAPAIHGLPPTGVLGRPLSESLASSLVVDAQFSSPAVKKGFLTLDGLGLLRLGLFKQQNRRYFTLEGDKLYYTERPLENDSISPILSPSRTSTQAVMQQPSVPIKCVDLATATDVVMNDDGTAFTIHTPEREYTLIASDKTETHYWHEAVRYAYLGCMLYDALSDTEAGRVPWKERVQECLDAGVDLNPDLGARSETPLYLAVATEDADVVRSLVRAGANPCLGHINGDQAIHLAVTRGSLEITRILLEFGADPWATDHNGVTAVHLLFKVTATIPPKPESLVLQLLAPLVKDMSPSSRIDTRAKTGLTPLMMAARANMKLVVTELINVGANVNAVNDMGQNAGHLSADRDCLALLTQFGLHGGARDKQGRTPLEVINQPSTPKQ